MTEKPPAPSGAFWFPGCDPRTVLRPLAPRRAERVVDANVALELLRRGSDAGVTRRFTELRPTDPEGDWRGCGKARANRAAWAWFDAEPPGMDVLRQLYGWGATDPAVVMLGRRTD